MRLTSPGPVPVRCEISRAVWNSPAASWSRHRCARASKAIRFSSGDATSPFAGILAERMEHVAALSSLVITPLTVLSGVFFAVAHLPAGFRFAVEFNPVFYLIDGFRQGFLPFAETDAGAGLAVVVGLDVVLFWICRRLFASGRGLKP